MMDFLDDHPGVVVFLSFCFVVLLFALIMHFENNDLKKFQARCEATGETRAKCELLTEIKASADSAAITAGAAIGLAGTR